MGIELFGFNAFFHAGSNSFIVEAPDSGPYHTRAPEACPFRRLLIPFHLLGKRADDVSAGEDFSCFCRAEDHGIGRPHIHPENIIQMQMVENMADLLSLHIIRACCGDMEEGRGGGGGGGQMLDILARNRLCPRLF
jgi:hypothetical protein